MIVVDCSVTASWFLSDEDNGYAQEVLTRLDEDETLLQPCHWLLEMLNVFKVAERRGRIAAEATKWAFAEIQHFPLQLESSPTLADVYVLEQLCSAHRLTPYDAEYLRLAKAHDVKLATLDKAMIKAAKSERIDLL